MEPTVYSAVSETRVSNTVEIRHGDQAWVRIVNRSIPSASVDLLFTRRSYGVGVTVLRREGDFEILTVE